MRRSAPRACLAAVITLALSASASSPESPSLATKLLIDAWAQAERIEDGVSRITLLQNLAAAQAQAGDIQDALAEASHLEAVVRAPPFNGNCNYIYEQVIRTQVRSGDFQSAEATLERIEGNKDEAHFAMAEEAAGVGRFDEAGALIDVVARPDNIRRRSQLSLDLAVIAARAGDHTAAKRLFDRADALAAQLNSEGTVALELSLQVAAKSKACGYGDMACHRFLEGAVAVAGVADSSKRQQYLEDLAEAAAAAGDLKLAEEVLPRIADPMRNGQAAAAIVRGYLSEGIDDIDAALRVAATISPYEPRFDSHAAIAVSQTRRGDKVAAQRTAMICQDLLAQASNDLRPWGSLALASLQYELGQNKRANVLCDEALSQADDFTTHPERERDALMIEIVRLRTRFGDREGALAVARKAHSGGLFQEIAQVEAEEGRIVAALNWIRGLVEPEERASALLGAARGLLGAQGEGQRVSGARPQPLCR